MIQLIVPAVAMNHRPEMKCVGSFDKEVVPLGMPEGK
jgi:hypothetical protein